MLYLRGFITQINNAKAAVQKQLEFHVANTTHNTSLNLSLSTGDPGGEATQQLFRCIPPMGEIVGGVGTFSGYEKQSKLFVL